MTLPNLSKYQGLIFDLDGTLINSMPFHVKAWTQVCKEHGFTLDPKLIYDLGGVSSLDVVAHLKQAGCDTGDADQFVRRKVAIYREHLQEVKTFPLVQKTLIEAKEQGKKIGIGTGTQLINAQDILKLTKLTRCVDALVTSESVTRHKPFPDTFLKAAEIMGLKPCDCVVFEDGPLGVKAALNGGFDCAEMLNGNCIAFHEAQKSL